MAIDVESELILRPGTPADTEPCGLICYEAFRTIAEEHRYPPDFPSADVGREVVGMLLSHPGFYSVVAERNGRILGSNFLDERSIIAGLGPITVDPEGQDSGVGKRLMLDALARAQERDFPGVRLLQAAYHTRSLSLYAKLGFELREPIATLHGEPLLESVSEHSVREAREEDIAECNEICAGVHGHDRSGELADAIRQGSARVVERDGRICGYTTGIAYLGHSVAETNDALKALIGAADEFPLPGFLLPLRNGELFRHYLSRGLQLVQVMTLMTTGMYQEPQGAYLPSILY
jgi:predicted N-acetyltransferase YhbS